MVAAQLVLSRAAQQGLSEELSRALSISRTSSAVRKCTSVTRSCTLMPPIHRLSRHLVCNRWYSSRMNRQTPCRLSNLRSVPSCHRRPPIQILMLTTTESCANLLGNLTCPVLPRLETTQMTRRVTLVTRNPLLLLMEMWIQHRRVPRLRLRTQRTRHCSQPL